MSFKYDASTIGKGFCSPVQSILFDVYKYSPYQAIQWLKNNKVKVVKHETSSLYHRFDQYTPLAGKRYGLKQIASGVKFCLQYH